MCLSPLCTATPRPARVIPGQGSSARPPSSLPSPNFELVKLQKALTSTMVKGLFVPAHRDFCISFSLCVVWWCGFKLNQKKKERERISTPDKKCVVIAQCEAACLLYYFFSKAGVPSEVRGLCFGSSIHRSGWRGALRFSEASGWLNLRRRIRRQVPHRLCCAYTG